MRFLQLLLLSFCLSACHHASEPNTLIIGTLAGPETELVDTANKIAQERYGLNIKVVEFNDYHLPNEALQEGSLDANVYQHLPYLEATNEAHHYNLIPLGKTFLYPMGVYSKRYKKLSKLPEQATIAIPNDPSNEARALLLLEHAGLIKLNPSKTPSVKDIKKNKRHFQFKTLDAAQLPRILPDVDAAVINTTFALPAGLNPRRDALLVESKKSPYVNLIVIRENTPKKELLEQFLKAFQSQEVKNKAKEIFGDAAIPAW